MCLAIPGQVQEIYQDHGVVMGKIDFGGVGKEVCLAFVPGVAVGDYVLVHAGFAMSRMDEESARETLRVFETLGILDEDREPGVMGSDAKECPVPPGEANSSRPTRLP